LTGYHCFRDLTTKASSGEMVEKEADVEEAKEPGVCGCVGAVHNGVAMPLKVPIRFSAELVVRFAPIHHMKDVRGFLADLCLCLGAVADEVVHCSPFAYEV
jgi:hypothetical protein